MCEHPRQVFTDGAWRCRSCDAIVAEKPEADFKSVRFNGLESLKVHREYGKTGREIGRDNVERFRQEKGYDPVPYDDKYRWL